MRKLYNSFRERRDRGFTLIELVLALTLSTMVIGIAVVLFQLLSRGVNNATTNASVIEADSNFVMQMNDAITKSSTSFTMPKSSFRLNNLTPGWNYLGMMYNVSVPSGASRTGRKIDNTNAFVYAEYKTTSTQNLPPDCIEVRSNTGEGYFIVKFLGHTYEDAYGVKYDYKLAFEPSNEGGKATNRVKYKFESTALKNNQPVGDTGQVLDVDTMLASLNAIQVTYRGSATDPATALAFRSDFVPSTTGTQRTDIKAVTLVTLILDYSGSMESSINTSWNANAEERKKRITKLRESVNEKIIEGLSGKGNVHLNVVPFSNCAKAPVIKYSGGYSNNGKHIFDLTKDDEKKLAKGFFSEAVVPSGGTNGADGIRAAYYEMKKFTEEKTKEGYSKINHLLVFMSDGMMNGLSLENKPTKHYNYGVYYVNKYSTFDKDGTPQYLCYFIDSNEAAFMECSKDTYSLSDKFSLTHSKTTLTKDKMYEKVTEFAEKIREDYKPQTFLMFIAQKKRDSHGNVEKDADGREILVGIPEEDRTALRTGFGTEQEFVADSAEAFDDAFNSITVDMSEVMFAFQGPSM